MLPWWYWGWGGGRGQGGWGRGGGWGGGGGRGWGSRFQGQPPLPNLTPPPPGCDRVAAGVENNNGLNSLLSHRFGRAPFILVVDVCNGRVNNVQIVPNTAAQLPRGAGVAVAQWLISNGVKIVITCNMGPHMETIINQAGIRVIQAEPGTPVIEILRRYGIVKV